MAERLTRPLLFFGIKHCGKSTLGRLTAEHFGVKFVDTDLELESRFQMLNGCPLPTRDIFRELGEEGFRRFEAETVEALAAQHGSTLKNEFTYALLQKFIKETVSAEFLPEFLH